ncbi:unnamed protein product [Didymodactylos carnosus]|uniref:Proteasome inhibitor PI31 subunit n=1 Tax=Didymodactylos carnosus TaxID=1234261 RepID=A0A814IH65_9BILA|nr:unnamed protein product [Didymodactylos carnosus]CAF3793005.1 unnamed protein product [Didymodactylos carnosus]
MADIRFSESVPEDVGKDPIGSDIFRPMNLILLDIFDYMSYPFLEILFDKNKDQIDSKDDALILFIHWCLVSRGFQRLNGNQKTELLPSDWTNHPDNSITMEYTKNDTGYNLKLFDVEGVFFAHLFRNKQGRHVEVSFSVNDHVHDNYKEFHSAYKNLNDLKKEFHEKIDSLTNGGGAGTTDSSVDLKTTQAGGSQQQQQGLSSTNQGGRYGGHQPQRQQPDIVDPLIDPLAARRYVPNSHIFGGPWPGGMGGAYGNSDLDPFGRSSRMGGGMLIDPRIFQPGLMGGPRPPTARYTPPGPMAPDPFQEPNLDHLRPSHHGSDDMYN